MSKLTEIILTAFISAALGSLAVFFALSQKVSNIEGALNSKASAEVVGELRGELTIMNEAINLGKSEELIARITRLSIAETENYLKTSSSILVLLEPSVEKIFESKLGSLLEASSQAEVKKISPEIVSTLVKASMDDLDVLVRENTNEIASVKKQLTVIKSGIVGIAAAQYPSLVDTSSCAVGADGFRGPKNIRINFDSPFTVKPELVLGISAFDIGKADNGVRIRVRRTGLDKNGFNYTLETWCNTSIQGAELSWTAIGR